MDFLVKYTGFVNDFMYTYILIILLIGIGVFYTIGTKFVQFRLLKDGFKAMLENLKKVLKMLTMQLKC